MAVGRLEPVAGVNRGLAGPRRLLEQCAGLRCLRGAGEGTRDQPPLLVWREHAARLKAGDESGMIGEKFAPQGPQPVLLGNHADFDAVARGAVIGCGRQRDRIERRALNRRRR